MRSASGLLRLATRTRAAVIVTVILTLVVAAALKLTTVLLLFHSGLPRKYLQGQDALMTGVLAAGFVWLFLETERARRSEEEAEIRVIADLNHHLRNALDVILASEYLRQSDRAAAILESVERIDKALGMILESQSDGVKGHRLRNPLRSRRHGDGSWSHD